MGNRKIILRFDDICPTMNWAEWNKAKEILDSIHATALLGVIPDCKDPDLQIDSPKDSFWEYIRNVQKEGYVIAMHGYQHIFDIRANGIVTPQKQSEFAGHSYEEQCNRINKGKKILQDHGIETDVFFAPAHSYDDNTLKALAANGFKYISDGMSRKPYKRNGIICLPCKSGGIPKIKETGLYTIVLHAHEWTYPQKENAWYKFKEICSTYQNDIVNFNSFRNEKCAPYLLGAIDERLYYLFRTLIVPKLVHLKKYLHND